MDAVGLALGFTAGVLATLAMLPTELLAYRRWGLRGVFEWHEIHASLAGYQSGRPFGAVGLAAHAILGGIVGAAFSIGRAIIPLPPFLIAFGIGVGLWVGTILLHERVTAVHPWRNPMGPGPAATTLVSHLAYGVALGCVTGLLLP